MRKKILMILVVLLIMSSSTTVLFANSIEGLEQFLTIFSSMGEGNRKLGAQILNSYLKDMTHGIRDLKNDLGMFLSENNIDTINLMGFTIDDIKSELDRLNTWSLDERSYLVKYISNGDSNGIKKLVNSAGKGVPPLSGDDGFSGGVNIPPNKDESKKDELIKVSFKDIDKHKNKEDIIYLSERGVIEGKTLERFDPDGNLTRAEFMTLIYRVLKLKPIDDKPLAFKDVKVGSWYYQYIKAAFDNKIIEGTSPTTFSPNAKVSRETMVVILMRILNDKEITFTLEKTDKDLLMYKDSDKISNWAELDMFYAVRYGIIKGRTDSTLNPRDFATRGEAAEIVKRLFDLIIK